MYELNLCLDLGWSQCPQRTIVRDALFERKRKSEYMYIFVNINTFVKLLKFCDSFLRKLYKSKIQYNMCFVMDLLLK
jgi:hypothetical protein